MTDLESELLFKISNKIIPEMIKRVKRGYVDSGYFKTLGMSKRIYEDGDYDLSVRLCNRLIKRGIQKTHLDFEKIDFALKTGRQKGDFLISLAREGRKYMDRMMGKERELH